jgi:hypothetical protein
LAELQQQNIKKEGLGLSPLGSSHPFNLQL